MGDPTPPLSTEVDSDVIHMIKWTRPYPSAFAYCKRSKNWMVGRPGNEATQYIHTYM